MLFTAFAAMLIHCSCFDAGVEELVNVNDVFKETPFSIGVDAGIKVGVDGSVDLLSHLSFLLGAHLNGLGLSDESDGSNCNVLEHYCFKIIN